MIPMMIEHYNNIKKYFVEKGHASVLYVAVLLLGIPLFYFYETAIVVPKIFVKYSLNYYVHIGLATFILVNVILNMFYAIVTNTSIQGKLLRPSHMNKGWSVCNACEAFRPPRAWHCRICNVCVLKRDHHCIFFATCIGYFNYRYFFLFTFYSCVALVYALYFNAWFLVKALTWNDKWILLKFAFPVVFLGMDFNPESIYVLIFVLNVLIVVVVIAIFSFHVKNVISGCTCAEKRRSQENDFNYGLKWNLVEAFGSKWYLTWISPFISSPLPGNGIDWIKCRKNSSKRYN